MLRFARDLLAAEKGPGAFAGPVIDIGTGCGFPGFVWTIGDDGLPVTLVERKEKAATFLERLAFSLKLDGLEIVRRDAEKDEIPGLFRVLTSKAAGRLGKMLPIAAKLLEPGGLYITVKERDWRWELEEEEAPEMNFLKEETIDGNRGTLVAFRR
jgi:16S rRNA (guanine527-N7)-methyltransferase